MLLTIIVPTLNEAGNVEELIRRIGEACTGIDAEVLFVDDSSDSTPQEILRCAERAPLPVRLDHRDKAEGGLSGAVVAGIAASRATYCLVMDGDLQHPPELVPVLLAQLQNGNAEVAVASRHCGPGEQGEALVTLYRKVVSVGVTTMTRSLFPVRLRDCTDPLTGFFAFRRDQVDLEVLRPGGFKILLEILVRNRLEVEEVPFVVGRRVAGESKANLTQGLRFLRHIGELRAGRVGLFAVVGGIGTVLNLLIMACLLGLGAHYIAAAVVAAEVTIVTNFVMQERLVFAGDRGTASAVRTRFAQSVGFNNAEALSRMPVLVLLVELLSINSIAAQAGTLAGAFVIRYLFHAKVVYRKRGDSSESAFPVDGEVVATASAAAAEPNTELPPESRGSDTTTGRGRRASSSAFDAPSGSRRPRTPSNRLVLAEGMGAES